MPRLNTLANAPLRAIALLLLAAACVEGDPATAPGTDSEATVTGSVAAVKTGQGVANLVVALMRDDEVVRVAATDADGRFELANVQGGNYVAKLTGLELSGLSASHTAFEPPAQEVRVTAATEPILFGVVGLIPPRVAGDVTCGGTPARGARIRVIGGGTDVEVITNAQGRFGATDLEPGHHAVLLIEAPCAVEPGWRAVELLPGQGVEVDFAG